MIQDWLRQNVIAVITGAVVASAIVGGSVVLVAVPETSLPSLGSAKVPDRFTVLVDGKASFDCRLVDATNHECRGEYGIYFERQPGDNTRLILGLAASGTKAQVVTWTALTTEGIQLGPTYGRGGRIDVPAIRVTTALPPS